MDMDLTLRAKEFASNDPFPMKGFGPVEWWVGNAFMAAQAFRALLGMEIVGYRGPEPGVSDRSSYLLRTDQIQFIVTGAQDGDHEISEHVKLHGPGVKDVGFLVPDGGNERPAIFEMFDMLRFPFLDENFNHAGKNWIIILAG